MVRPFFLHPCPECYGNVRWLARECGFCEQPITWSQRIDHLTPDEVKVLPFYALTITFLLDRIELLDMLFIGVLLPCLN